MGTRSRLRKGRLTQPRAPEKSAPVQSAGRKLISLALTGSGQSIDVCLSSQLAARTWWPDQRGSSPHHTVCSIVTEDFPTFVTVSRNVSRSPKNEGFEKLHVRCTVGVPQRSFQMISCQGKPMLVQNSSMTPLRMLRYDG